jgi:hypothetical protein
MMSKLLLRVIATVRVKAAFAVVRLLPLISPCRDVLGVRSYLALTDWNEIARASSQLRAALELIAECDPQRFSRLRADLRGILVHPFSKKPRGRFNRSFGYCELSRSLALNEDHINIACTIVHEAAHARLCRFKANNPARRVRLEQVCMRQELAFLEKVPDTGDRMNEVKAVLAGLNLNMYTDEAMWSEILSEWKTASVS